MLRPYPTGRLAQQPVRDLVHGAVTADGHDAAGTRAHRRCGERDAVAGMIGALGLHGPTLAAELTHNRVERARGRAAPRGGIEDDVGMNQTPIISIEARSGSASGLRHQAVDTTELPVRQPTFPSPRASRPGSVE